MQMAADEASGKEAIRETIAAKQKEAFFWLEHARNSCQMERAGIVATAFRKAWVAWQKTLAMCIAAERNLSVASVKKIDASATRAKAHTEAACKLLGGTIDLGLKRKAKKAEKTGGTDVDEENRSEKEKEDEYGRVV